MKNVLLICAFALIALSSFFYSTDVELRELFRSSGFRRAVVLAVCLLIFLFLANLIYGRPSLDVFSIAFASTVVVCELYRLRFTRGIRRRKLKKGSVN
jgi:hypothetical protein